MKSNGKRDSSGRAVNERKWGLGERRWERKEERRKDKKRKKKIKDKNTWERRDKVRKINKKEKEYIHFFFVVIISQV